MSNGLRNLFDDVKTTLTDTNTIIESSRDATYLLNLFAIMISLVAIILSFFLILVSFTANIKDNSWEFGVLRAIGLTINQLSRIYIYEALILVVASGLIGTIVGIVIAVTLTLQILMFMELPFQFVFPYT